MSFLLNISPLRLYDNYADYYYPTGTTHSFFSQVLLYYIMFFGFCQIVLFEEKKNLSNLITFLNI